MKIAAVVVAFALASSAALADPLPLPTPKVGTCATGYHQAGGFCAPDRTTARPVLPKLEGVQCPTGWTSEARYCVGPVTPRR